MSFANYELSMEIMRSKAENIKDTGADILATACPGCMIQIKDGLNRFDVKTDVKHVVELFLRPLTRDTQPAFGYFLSK